MRPNLIALRPNSLEKVITRPTAQQHAQSAGKQGEQAHSESHQQK
jgi:hypothetical protein